VYRSDSREGQPVHPPAQIEERGDQRAQLGGIHAREHRDVCAGAEHLAVAAQQQRAQSVCSLDLADRG
jgi:hypothetical protein